MHWCPVKKWYWSVSCKQYFPWENSGRHKQTALIKPLCTRPFRYQWSCLNCRLMWWTVCLWGTNLSFDSTRERKAVYMLSQEFKGRHIACLIPELQKVHDYVTLNTARRLKLQSWNESYFCCMKVNFLQGKMSRRTPEGTLSFCSNPGCKVLSKHKVIWDTHSFSFFGISRLLRESLSTLTEK